MDIPNKKKLERNLECPVCIDILNGPRILTSCGHTLCSDCITIISKKKDNIFLVECPTCLKVTEYTGNIDDLNKNYTLHSVIEEIKSKKKTSYSFPKENYFKKRKLIRKKSKSLPDLQIYNDQNYNDQITIVSPYIAKPVEENFNLIEEENEQKDNQTSIFRVLFSSLLKPCEKR